MKTYVRYAITIALAAILLPCITAQAVPDIVQQKQQQAKPLSFIENKGQITDQHGRHRGDIDYKLETPGMNIYVGDGQLHYQWTQAGEGKNVNTYRMDVVLAGANTQAQVVATEAQDYYEQYYLPQCSEGAIAHSYNRITYKDIYPNIDWVIYSKDKELKYDFVVRAGGNPTQIKLRYEGATKLVLQQDGALKASTPMGSITEQPPYSYVAGTNKMVASRYRLDGNSLQYELAPAEGTVVIDPTLAWATYCGGSGGPGGEGAHASSAMDATGNVFLSSNTRSTSNIATTGAYQTSYAAGGDLYLTKFSSSGVRQWATYYGGSGDDFISQVTCDALGNVYIAGYTYSNNGIASTGAHQTIFNGGVTTAGGDKDGFLAKFNAAGTRQWATYYGGVNWEEGYAVACDPLGNVYLGGRSGSQSGIATTGSHQSSLSTSPSTAGDAFIVKFNTAGVRQWGTYYGGNTGSQLYALGCDLSGNLYVAGFTASTSGIATTGAYQASLPGSNGSGFLAKFNSSGVRQWGTYFNILTYIQGLVCSPTDLYIAGFTTSTSLATTGAYQTSLAGGEDGFVAKFDLSGNLAWATYLGGSANDEFKGIALDAANNIYAAGVTKSTSGITTFNALMPVYNGGSEDGLLAQFSPSGSLLFASYYGGSSTDVFGVVYGGGLPGGALSGNGALVAAAGVTGSTSNIATSGAHQTTMSGINDNMLVVLGTDTMVYITQPYNDTAVCPGDTLRVGYGVAPGFRSGNTFTVQLSDAGGSFATPVNIGTVTATGAGTIKAVAPANTTAGTGYRVRIVSSLPARTSQNNGINIRVKTAPVVPTATSNSPVCVGGNLTVDVNSSTAGVTYAWSGPNSFTSTTKNPTLFSVTTAAGGDYRVAVTLTSSGCTLRDTVTAVIQALPATPVATNNGPICAGDMLSLSATSSTPGVSYSWTGPGGFTSSFQNPTISSTTTANGGTYSVIATANGCTSMPGTTVATIKPLPATPAITSNSPVCLGGTLTLDAASDPGSTYEWGGPNGFSSTLKNPSIAAVTKAAQGNYTVRATLNGCKSTTANSYVTVNIVANIGGYASPNDTICKGDTVTFVGFPQNGGPAPVFEWYKNGVVVTNNKIFNTSDVKTGDKFWCTMTAPNICGPIPVVISTDTIRMVVEGIQVTPVVKISASPAVTGDPAQSILFTATPQWGGTSPKYMWYKNGVATGNKLSTWSTSGIRIGDVISVEMESQHPCAAVTGAADTVAVQFPTSVKEQNNHNISLYPNPNKGSFTIEDITAAQVQLSIINVLGQVVYTHTQQQVNGSMGIDAKLPVGAYLVRMQADGQSYTLRFNVAE